MESQKIIIEKHSNGYVAYPLGLKGVREIAVTLRRQQSAIRSRLAKLNLVASA